MPSRRKATDAEICGSPLTHLRNSFEKISTNVAREVYPGDAVNRRPSFFVRLRRPLSISLACFALGSCGFIPEGVALSDPRIKPLLDAIAAADRASLGFTPIPPDADVRWERRPRRDYDAMLHIYARTSRTISFRKTAEGFRWSGEQEIYTGPNTYDSVDGKYREHISVTYKTDRAASQELQLKDLSIRYWGEDARLRRPKDLTWAEIKPVLTEWGF